MLRVSAHVRRGGGTRTLTCAAEVVARDEEPPPLLPPPSPLSGSKSTASPTTSCGVSIAKAHVRSKKCAAGWLCVKAANRGSHHPIIRSRTFRNDHSTNRLLHASDSAQRCDGHHCRSFWLARWPSNSRVAGNCVHYVARAQGNHSPANCAAGQRAVRTVAALRCPEASYQSCEPPHKAPPPARRRPCCGVAVQVRSAPGAERRAGSSSRNMAIGRVGDNTSRCA